MPTKICWRCLVFCQSLLPVYSQTRETFFTCQQRLDDVIRSAIIINNADIKQSIKSIERCNTESQYQITICSLQCPCAIAQYNVFESEQCKQMSTIFNTNWTHWFHVYCFASLCVFCSVILGPSFNFFCKFHWHLAGRWSLIR